MRNSILLLLLTFTTPILANQLKVCADCEVSSIKTAIELADSGDTLMILEGIYKEHDLVVNKPLTILGQGNAVIDAESKGTIFNFNTDRFTLSGMTLRNIGLSYIKEHAAIYVTRADSFSITHNTMEMVFFGCLIEKSHYGEIAYNEISSKAEMEASSGNGVHMWHCSNLEVHHNKLHGLRDGIYLEFVDSSVMHHNLSYDNLRYGLHFMFSNNDDYHHNTFIDNGAGVAVMFSKVINMYGNTFRENWGTASYGLLLKEIYDGELYDNHFEQNTIGINVEGSNRINYKNNTFKRNGWAVKIVGACYNNRFTENDFMYNSFDLSYHSKLNDNAFDNNYWSEYTGYDRDRDGIGDIPYRPVKLFSYIVNRTPETIILLRSLFVFIINFSEKVSPIFTPDNLIDEHPKMKPARDIRS